MTTHQYFDLTQPNGFPLNQDRLKLMQEAYTESLGAIAGMIGNSAIVTGCVVTGTNVSDGWLAINGELLPFVASAIGASIIVVAESTPLTFSDGSKKNVQFNKTAKFGTGAGAVAWNSFTRLSSSVDTAKHITDKNNPHAVTKSHVGLGNLPNAVTNDPGVSDPNILATSVAVNKRLGNIPNNITDDPSISASNFVASAKMVNARVSNLPNYKSDRVDLNNSESLATSKAVNDKLNNLPNAKNDAVNLNNSNTLATSKAVNDKLSNLPNAKSDDPAISSSSILATSKAVNEVYLQAKKAISYWSGSTVKNWAHNSLATFGVSQLDGSKIAYLHVSFVCTANHTLGYVNYKIGDRIYPSELTITIIDKTIMVRMGNIKALSDFATHSLENIDPSKFEIVLQTYSKE